MKREEGEEEDAEKDTEVLGQGWNMEHEEALWVCINALFADRKGTGKTNALTVKTRTSQGMIML